MGKKNRGGGIVNDLIERQKIMVLLYKAPWVLQTVQNEACGGIDMHDPFCIVWYNPAMANKKHS